MPHKGHSFRNQKRRSGLSRKQRRKEGEFLDGIKKSLNGTVIKPKKVQNTGVEQSATGLGKPEKKSSKGGKRRNKESKALLVKELYPDLYKPSVPGGNKSSTEGNTVMSAEGKGEAPINIGAGI